MVKLKVFLLISFTLTFGLELGGCSFTQQAHKESQKSDVGSSQFKKAIQDELNGLTILEKDVNKSDFKGASDQFEKMHTEFHAAVLPPIEAKDPKLGEEMHAKFDSLDDAIGKNDKASILSNVKTNRDSLQKATKQFGIK